MSLLRRKKAGLEENEEQASLGVHWRLRSDRSKKRSYSRFRYGAVALCSALFFLLYIKYALVSQNTHLSVSNASHNHICKVKNTFDKGSKIGCNIETAISHFNSMMKRQSKTPEEAERNYIKRYKRSPPSGFRAWAAYALHHNATIIDDYDQIDIDLTPFRGYSQAWLKQRLTAAKASWPTGQLGSIRVLNGTLTVDGPRSTGALSAYTLEMVLEPIVDRLPNLDVLFNWYAEPRVRASDQNRSNKTNVDYLDYSQQSTWPFITSTCSDSRRYLRLRRHSTDDICRGRQHLEPYHGFFNAPNQFRPTEDLVPMLSRAKLSTFQDILVPNVCYASKDWRLFDYRDKKPFTEKKSSLYWRGSSTGQQMTKKNWTTSHRIRLVRYLQWLSDMSAQIRASPSEVPKGMSSSTARSLSRLGPETFDARISKYNNCDKQLCKALKEKVGLAELKLPVSAYEHKFLFDSDGQSMSCRFYHLLGTNSVVFKSTIWDEWHNERLIPWLHYIPISVKLQEIPELLDYFINDEKGQKYAELIAASSRSWSEQSLRIVDLTIYYYRLLLEFGALGD
ncbi:hypothetical protein CBS101457_006930 [Exobasidium rhododendri]|nr:hypothetical protein CBS101457_006930 [Exobasidium rhododendri]